MRRKVDDQDQKIEKDSFGIQAGGNVTVGISYAEARQIALDVFNANFLQLSIKAKEQANERGEAITEKFLKKLQTDFPAGILKAEDPDFQYALFTVQKEYARSGDEKLGDLLVDILVDRCKQDNRNILQIVLNESLHTAPKLTEDQLAALSLIFIFKYLQNLSLLNHEKLGVYLDSIVFPVVNKIVKNLTCYQHLEYCGCGSIGLGQVPLQRILSSTYKGLFMKGFEMHVITDRNLDYNAFQGFFINCLNDPSKFQVNALNKERLSLKIEREKIDKLNADIITQLFDYENMNEEEIKGKCIEIRPYMATLIEIWNDSPMNMFTLTSVGEAIAHANIKRYSSENIDLSIWIN